jgi:hypothetical protein
LRRVTPCVAINARRLSSPKIISGSGRHRARAILARDNVYCVIEQPLKAKARPED